MSESKSRVCNVMVQNPIYDGDGPVYESVQTQLETELNISQSEDTTDQRYNNLHTDNIVSDDSTMVNAPISGSASMSMPLTTSRVMGLKKNGQERNKLCLTLYMSLGSNDSSNSHTNEVMPESIPKMCAVAPADMGEPYTVMRPASVRITN